MSTELETKLNSILNEKTTKIIPENIKKDVQIFDITGTYEGSGPVGLGKLQSYNETTIEFKDIIEPKYYKDYIRQINKVISAMSEMHSYYTAHQTDIDLYDDYWDNPELTNERKLEIQEAKDTYSAMQQQVSTMDTVNLYGKFLVSYVEDSEEEGEEEELPENEGEVYINIYAPVSVVMANAWYFYIDVDDFQSIHDYLEYNGNIDLVYEDESPMTTGWYVIDTSDEGQDESESDSHAIPMHKTDAPSVHMQSLQILVTEGMYEAAFLDETTVNSCMESVESDNIEEKIQINLRNVDEYTKNGLYYVVVYEDGGSPSEPIRESVQIYAALSGTKPVDVSFTIPNTEDTDIILGLYSDEHGLAHNFTINTDDNINQIIDIDISGYSINEDVSL